MNNDNYDEKTQEQTDYGFVFIAFRFIFIILIMISIIAAKLVSKEAEKIIKTFYKEEFSVDINAEDYLEE